MSPPRPRHRRTRLADLDYVAALRFSRKAFGDAQAQLYKGLLDVAIDAAASEPDCIDTRKRDDLAEGARSFHIRNVDPKGTARHVLHYRVAKDGVVEILRILHDRMEPSHHAR